MEENNIKSNWHLLKYTLFAENPDNKNEIYCVNLLAGTCFILTHEEFILLFKLSSLNENNDALKKFIQQGIVINFDETALMETLVRQICKPSDSIKIAICPTIACNFNCPYCFENHKTGKMSLEVENDIIKLLKRILDNNDKIKNINVIWYGGEPLLAPQIIESLSKKIINFCNINNLFYTASIITNGYLLNQKNANILKNAKVLQYQITLDGIEEVHDKTRHLIDGSSTFNKIIDNLYNVKIEGNINIRHNVYEENYCDIEKLKDLIEKIQEKSGNKLSYYTYPVANNSVFDARKEKLQLLKMDKINNIEILKDVQYFNKTNGQFCGSQSLDFFAIDDQGRLYKCLQDVDKPERSFGNIKTWNPSNPLYSAKCPNNLLNYLNTAGALDDLECQECILLPFCKGGCPNKRLYYKKKCVAYKNNPEDLVLELAKRYLNKNNNFLDK